MTISGTLEFSTNFATSAAQAADAGRVFLGVLREISSEAKTFDGLGSSIAKVAAAQIAADAKLEQQRIRGAQQAEQQAARVAAAQAQQQARLVAQAEQQQAKLVAADAAQRNAAMAKLIQAQVDGAQRAAAIEAKGAADASAIREKGAAKAAELEAKLYADLMKGAQRAATKGAGPGSAVGASGAATPGLDGSQGIGLLGELMSGGGLKSLLGAAGLGEMAGPLAAAAGQLVGAVEALAATIAGLVRAGAQIAIDSGAFRENTEIAFEGFLGSEQGAADLYEKALDLADKVGLSKEDTVKKISALLTAGMGDKEALEAVRVVADLTQVRGEAAGNKLNAVLMKIAAADKIDVRNISALRSIGIQTEAVYEAIGQAIGKTAKEAELAVKAGQVDAKVGAAAVEAVVEKTFGGLAERAGKTIPRLIGDIEDEFKRLFDKINTGPLKGFLSNISDVLTGPGGERLRASLERFFGATFKALFGGLEGEDGAQRIENVVETLSRGLDKGADVAERAAPALLAIVKILDLIGGKNEEAAATADTLGKIDRVLRAITTMDLGAMLNLGLDLGIGLAQILGLEDVVPELEAMKAQIEAFFANFSLSGLFSAFTGAGSKAGEGLIDGIVNGITSGISKVVDAITSMATKGAAALTGAWKVKSPSQLFYDIAGWVPVGAANAITDGAYRVEGAARTMAIDAANAAMLGPRTSANVNAGGGAARGTGVASASTAAAAGVASAGGGAAPVLNFAEGSIVIHASTEEEGRAAARGFWAELRELAEVA